MWHLAVKLSLSRSWLLKHAEKHFINIWTKRLCSCNRIVQFKCTCIYYFLLEGSCFPLSYTSVHLRVQCHGCPLPTGLNASLFLPSAVRIPTLTTEAAWWTGSDEDWVGNLLLVVNLFYFLHRYYLTNLLKSNHTSLNCHLIIILRYAIRILKMKLKGLIKHMNI